jgi:hypothetical protein
VGTTRSVPTPAGGLITAWGSIGRRPGRFIRPTFVATDPLGYVYVVDAAEGAHSAGFDPGIARIQKRLRFWRRCASPKRYAGLRPGVKSFQVRVFKDLEPGRAATRWWRIVKRPAR